MIGTMNLSVHLLISILFLFTSCSKSGYFGNGDTTTDTQGQLSSKQITSGDANGTSSSLISNGETSIKIVASEDVLWSDFTIDLGADFLESNICSGKIIFGRTGSALCGASAWSVSALTLDSSNIGSLNGSIYSFSAVANAAHNTINLNMGSDFSTLNVCSTKSILGLSGTAICLAASGGTNATASNVLSGTYFWNSDGISTAGTLNLNIFSDLSASSMSRDVTTSQMTLTSETSTSSYAIGYRNIPDIYKDDEGYFDSVRACGNTGGITDTCTKIVKATRPSVTCGTTQNTLNARTVDCLLKNGASAQWDGSTKGNSGEGSWELVTRTASAEEVWRDKRTKLVWGDTSAWDSWCKATGNAQADGYCNGNTTSYCAEEGSLTSAIAGENWTTGVYDKTKGAMGAIASATSPSVRWRLPTRNDWLQAEVNGIRYVLPNMSEIFWSVTLDSSDRYKAWNFSGYYGHINNVLRGNGHGVRCIGR